MHTVLYSTAPSTKWKQRWKAGQFRDLKKDAPYWQAAFRARLANRLQEAGYRIERKKDDFDITGFSKDVLEAIFSSYGQD